jgi:hypothetical protein
MTSRFTVGVRAGDRTEHLAVEADDALAAALKVKAEWPDAVICYVRPRNRRGDARHPPLELLER